jgi:hypothetical protein
LWQTALQTANCKLLSNVLRFATKETTPWQSALKFRLLTMAIRNIIIFFMAIRSMIIFFVAIRGLNTMVCYGPRYTFERGLPQHSEIQYQPFYIDSPPVHGAASY